MNGNLYKDASWNISQVAIAYLFVAEYWKMKDPTQKCDEIA